MVAGGGPGPRGSNVTDGEPSSVDTYLFGRTPEGQMVHRVVLSRQDGLEVAVLTYGATLQSIVPRVEMARDGASSSVSGASTVTRARRTITSERPLADTPTASPVADSSSMARPTGYLATRERIIFMEGTSVSTGRSGRSDAAAARARRASPLATTASTGKRGIRVPLTSRSSSRWCVRTRCGSDTERARTGGRSSI